MSRSTIYNPPGKDLVERYNEIIWFRVREVSMWEIILPQVLYCIRGMVSTATNECFITNEGQQLDIRSLHGCLNLGIF